MAILVKCPNPACGKQFSLRDEQAGKTVRCDACRQTFQVPARTAKTAAPTPPPDPLIGVKIAHYKIESLLGQGGMGKVYKAHNVNLDKSCAIKILPQEFSKQDQTSIDRFIREARSAAKVEHPNVLPVQFIGKVANDYFIEMLYVDGGTLDGLLRNCGKIDVKQAARIIRDVASGLQAAHEKGIIHRDIKPTNVMLTSKGHIYVMDFGLAKMGEARSALTQQGFILGTPLYMSPEQATGQPVDQRSDIYSVGVMFYQLITGTPPYTADSPVAILFQHQSAPIPDIMQVAPRTPPPIAEMIRRMMAKNPNDRYQSCAEVVRDMDAFLASPDQPTVFVPDADLQAATDRRRSVLSQAKRSAPSRAAAKAPSSVAPAPRRRRAWPLVVGAIAALAAIGAIGLYFFTTGENTQPPVANVAQPPLQPGSGQASAVPAAQPAKSAWDDLYVATAATGDKIPHPLSRKTSKQTLADGTTIDVPEGMVYVPPGEFTMGEGDQPPEGPEHKVYLNAYFMGRYEVTNAEYGEFLKATGRPPRWVPKGLGNHPVSTVTWEDAKAYSEWCGRRLPTEAEWEKAAGWDATKQHRNEFPWGDVYDPEKANHCYQRGCPCNGDAQVHRAWTEKNVAGKHSRDFLAAVGQFKADASPYGCFDMAGNVSEWVADWYRTDYYMTSPERNPTGPSKEQAEILPADRYKTSGACRVIRGGFCASDRYGIRVWHRSLYPPTTGRTFVGFRCAADCPWRPQEGAEGGKAESEARTEDGFISLFNGQDLTGWHVMGPPGQKWEAENGILKCLGGPRGWLRTEKEYTDFELRLDFKLTPKANSGVFLHAPARPGDPAFAGMEIQILDDADKTTPGKDSTGAVYAAIAPAAIATKPPGEWNTFDITLKGMQLTVILNGQTIQNVDLAAPELEKQLKEQSAMAEERYKAAVEKAKAEGRKPPGRQIPRPFSERTKTGFIGLQNYGNEVEFRNIRIKPLDAGGAPAEHPTTGAVDDAFVREVAALSPEEQVKRVVAELQKLNPRFDGTEKHKVEGNDVVELEFSAINVTDISPVRALKKLRRFVCVASTNGKQRSKLTDLRPLQGLSLKELRVPGCDVSDLSPVRGMPLDHVGISYTLVSDLSPLKGAPLGTVHCIGTPISDLSVLAGSALTFLACGQTPVRDLAPLRTTRLQKLQCDEAVAKTPANREVLRSIQTLQKINNRPVVEFWK